MQMRNSCLAFVLCNEYFHSGRVCKGPMILVFFLIVEVFVSFQTHDSNEFDRKTKYVFNGNLKIKICMNICRVQIVDKKDQRSGTFLSLFLYHVST
jgi:hypothetical protein